MPCDPWTLPPVREQNADVMSHLPNFFILGAPKSGTTTLYHALEKHPAVHLSTPKEPYYFEDEYEQGPEFYWRTYFAAGWKGQSLIGDARAAHLYLPYVPRRIYTTVPEARLVAILRNPVERAFSHWWMRHSHGREPLGRWPAQRAPGKPNGPQNPHDPAEDVQHIR